MYANSKSASPVSRMGRLTSCRHWIRRWVLKLLILQVSMSMVLRSLENWLRETLAAASAVTERGIQLMRWLHLGWDLRVEECGRVEMAYSTDSRADGNTGE